MAMILFRGERLLAPLTQLIRTRHVRRTKFDSRVAPAGNAKSRLAAAFYKMGSIFARTR
jgi:hypothetical protein